MCFQVSGIFTVIWEELPKNFVYSSDRLSPSSKNTNFYCITVFFEYFFLKKRNYRLHFGKERLKFAWNHKLVGKCLASSEFEPTPEQRERSTCLILTKGLICFVAETYAKLKMTANYSRLNGQKKIKMDGPNTEKFLEDIEVWFALHISVLYTYACR